jgi:hypothetical protein
VELNFDVGKNPNNGDLPNFIAVRFPQYTGPAWDKNDPKVSIENGEAQGLVTRTSLTYYSLCRQIVPIPYRETTCDKGCCRKKYVPLTLAFATTLHTCQGINAGPTQPGQPSNAVQKIILDPGNKQFETFCPGLFYVGLSRATTMGNGDKMKSAIYFMGQNIKRDRLLRMTYKTNSNEKLLRVLRRDAWTSELDKNEHKGNTSDKTAKKLFRWAEHAIYTKEWKLERLAKDSYGSDVP